MQLTAAVLLVLQQLEGVASLAFIAAKQVAHPQHSQRDLHSNVVSVLCPAGSRNHHDSLVKEQQRQPCASSWHSEGQPAAVQHPRAAPHTNRWKAHEARVLWRVEQQRSGDGSSGQNSEG
jgi:hypothetical protein